MINTDRIVFDPSKVYATLKYDSPQNVSEIPSLFGLAGYSRHFIEGFSKIALPMTQQTRKGKTYEWTKECETSFQELKTRLTSFLLLVLLDPFGHF